MGNTPSAPPSDRRLGDAYPGAADPHPVPSRGEAVAMVMSFAGVDDEAVATRVLRDNGWDANAAAASLLATGGLELMEVTVPQGTAPGQTIVVRTPRGQCSVDVPAGLCAGDAMTFRLPVPESGAAPQVAVARAVGSFDAGVHSQADEDALTRAAESDTGAYAADCNGGYEARPRPRPGRTTVPAGFMPPEPGRRYRFL
jgi:hypothetical protein|eukprot:3760182-Prymnesium_polylepis.1